MTKFQEYEIFTTPEELAVYVGKLWQKLQSVTTKEGTFYLSSPLSSTPLPLYQWVVENADSFKGWRNFRFILMDEQVEGNSLKKFSYISVKDPASYERFAREKLLNPLIERGCVSPLSNIILKPDIQNLSAFDDLIAKHKGIDLLILALGVKGHYAQVMPGTPLETGFHIVKLIPELAQVHTQKGSKSYEGAQFREYGMSLGHQQVLNAKNVVVMISGEKKRELAQELFSYTDFHSGFPLSIIHHPDIAPKTRVLLSREVAVA